MRQWTAAGASARFALIVHHTDAACEWSCDRQSAVGKRDKALDAAQAQGKTAVDMKNGWKNIPAFN